MAQDYPSDADILTYLTAHGLEYIAEDDENWLAEIRHIWWRLLNAHESARALSVYSSEAGKVKVIGGEYRWNDTLKTYAGSAAITPADDDTSYVWMKSDNTVDSGTDAAGWPDVDHIKLAEVVKASGVVTDVIDQRPIVSFGVGAEFNEPGATLIVPAFGYWKAPSPANNDEIQVPFYGKSSTGIKREYAQLAMKATDVTNASEDATLSYSVMVGGALTSMGYVVGSTATQTLTNKTFDADNNTASNFEHGAEVDNPSSGVHGAVGDIVGTTDTQTLTNKTFTDNVTYFQDDGDNSKKAQFNCGTISAATTRIYSLPDGSTSLVGLNTTQLLSNKNLNDTNNYVVDNGDVTKKMRFECSGISAATTRVMSAPDMNITLMGPESVVCIGDAVVCNNNTVVTL